MLSGTNPIVYSVPITDPTKTQGETAVYRHPDAVSQLTTKIKRIPHIETLQQLHEYASTEFSQNNCLGSRVKLPDGSLGHYEFRTYQTTYNDARKAGSAILNLDLAPVVHHEGYSAGRFIVVYEKNCEQWLTLDIGCCLYGITLVPVFDSLGLEAVEYIFSQTEVSTVFASGSNIDLLLEGAKAGKICNVNTVVCMQGYTQNQKEFAASINFRLISWEELLAGGQEILPYPKVTPDTVFTLGYTSGTTGVPKGAVITHENIISAIAGCEENDCINLMITGNKDIHLSYLPLAHIFERVWAQQLLCQGATIGFFSGNVQKLSEDLQTLKPTCLISVPRLYNRFYAGILAQLEKIPQAKELLQNPEISPVEVLEKLSPDVLAKFRSITGGNSKGYITGSAPISPDILNFLRVAFGAPIMEGFGQTETCSGVFLQRPTDPSAGNIGGPYTNVEFKLVDVPEMNYSSQDKGPNGEPMPRGELCLRGGGIFKGYYRDPERTAEATDAQGWHHTGDVAALLPNGSVKLIDRSKNIFKLSQGEYIAPGKIENIFLSNRYVAETFVYGDSFQSEIVAIIVPNKDVLLELGQSLGLGHKTYEELCKDPNLIASVSADIMKTGKEAKLLSYELAKNIHIEPQSFAILGLMTPSMKLKRAQAPKYYDDVLKKLYKSASNSISGS